jgi:ABC-type nitrate/sulfonate/bicarbonate transport system substrate-binding protein
MTRRSVLAMAGVVGAGTLAGGLAGRGMSAFAAEALKPVRIVNPGGSLSLIFREMIAQGKYFEALGVEHTYTSVADASKVIATLVSNSGDLCTGMGLSSLFSAIERGAKIKIVGAVITTPTLAIFSKRPDIKSVKDLVGKNVGIGAPGTLLHQEVVALLTKEGVDYKKVNFVNVGSSLDVFRAVAAGTVDAGPGTSDFFGQQAKYGVHALEDGVLWNELPDYTEQAMVASEKAVAENRDALVRVMAAHIKMYRAVMSPDSFETWFKARSAALNNSDRSEAETQWKFFQAPGRLSADLLLSEQSFNYVQDFAIKLGVQKQTLSYGQCVDMSLARDALKLVA